jgi:preprotein translocase subunit Sec63
MAAASSEERRVGVDASGAVDVDLYGVLGLKKECSDADLRLAYRRLAMVST